MKRSPVDIHILPKVNVELKIGFKIYNFTKWDFSNLGLTSIPKELIEYFAQGNEFHGLLDFSNNSISTIPEKLFLGDTRVIDLSYNQLSRLPKDMLQNSVVGLNLSHNKFDKVPILTIKNSYNLLSLIMTDNMIRNITIKQSQILLEIANINFDNNLLNVNYEEKEQAGLRMGVLDKEKSQISKFKFREIVGREGEGTLMNHLLSRKWDNEFHENKDQFYVKFFEILSIQRFEYYDELDTSLRASDKNYQQFDSRIFWERMEKLRYKFRDISVGHSTFSNFYILYLTNPERVEQFEEWLKMAFDGCLIE